MPRSKRQRRADHRCQLLLRHRQVAQIRITKPHRLRRNQTLLHHQLRIRAEVTIITKESWLFGTWGLVVLIGFLIQQYARLTPVGIDYSWAVLSAIGIVVSFWALPWKYSNLRNILITWVAITIVGGAFTSAAIRNIGSFGQYTITINVVWAALIGIGYALTALFDDAFIFNYFAVLAAIDLTIFFASPDFYVNESAVILGITLGLPLFLLAFKGRSYKILQPVA